MVISPLLSLVILVKHLKILELGAITVVEETVSDDISRIGVPGHLGVELDPTVPIGFHLELIPTTPQITIAIHIIFKGRVPLPTAQFTMNNAGLG